MSFSLRDSRGLCALLALLAACSGGSGGGGGGLSTMSITGCSLGCGAVGNQLACSNLQVAVNQEMALAFTRPVAESSLDKSTVQLVNVQSGKAPPYQLSIDPTDPRRVLIRPLLSFDSAGTPIFGLDAGASYDLRVPGASQDPGPWVESTDGIPNEVRLACTIAATQGVVDTVPGPPSVSVFVDVVDSTSGSPVVVPDAPAAGAVDVSSGSDITLRFDDLMNPATLVDPIAKDSETIGVFVDVDGVVSDPSDRVPLFGTYELELDQTARRTSVVFTPALGLPSAGSGAVKRRVVVSFAGAISDLGGNGLSNPNDVAFTPEVLAFSPVLLPDGAPEDFDDVELLDRLASGGGMWGEAIALFGDSVTGVVPGIGGAAGRHGTIRVEAGETLVLRTDVQELVAEQIYPDEVHHVGPGGTVQAVIDVQDAVDAGVTGAEDDPLVVTGGVFEIGSLDVESGGILRFEGPNPARLYVRGRASVDGIIDASGDSPIDHDSSLVDGQPGGTPGPGAGAGGQGGDRFDNTGQDFLTMGLGGVANPGAVPDGEPGGGMALPGGGTAPVGGDGGAPLPTIHPASATAPEVDNSMCLFTTDPAYPGPSHFCVRIAALIDSIACQSDQQGGQGAGGAHAFDATAGDWEPATFASPLLADPFPATGSTSAAPLGIEPFDQPHVLRTLDPELGYLRGGAGGGGGGASLARTSTNGNPLFICTLGSPPPLQISTYLSHSGAAGGGGGGGIQVQTGERFELLGRLDASGGDGGSHRDGATEAESWAAPGGGGAGGGALVQSREIVHAGLPARVDVSGGLSGVGQNGLEGGFGSTGLARIEVDTQAAPLDPLELAQLVTPFDDDDGDGMGDDDSDDDDGDGDPFDEDELDLGGKFSPAILSTAPWVASASGPGSISGVRSCWLQPEGGFFFVDYLSDAGGELGWDLDVVYTVAGPSGELLVESYRGPSTVFGGQTLADACGSDLDDAPVLVRFQGARRVQPLEDPCSPGAAEPGGSILPESKTAWVRHPDELNVFWDFLGAAEAAKRKPDLVRVLILFDRGDACAPMVAGVTNLSIRALPD